MEEKNKQIEFAQEKLLKELSIIPLKYLKFEDNTSLSEFYLLLNRKQPMIQIHNFPIYLTYVKGEIFIESSIPTKKELFINYSHYKKELFSDETTLFYDASSRDMLILLKDKSSKHSNFCDKFKIYFNECFTRNIDVNKIFKLCLSLWEIDKIYYLLDNYKINNSDSYLFYDIVWNNNNLSQFKKIMSYGIFNTKENLEYALGAYYGILKDNYVEYLLLELNVKFNSKAYRYAAIFSVQKLNFKRLEKISKRIDIKFNNQHLLSFGIFTKNINMLQYLINKGFNINNNCKDTLLNICIVNDVKILNFLLNKGFKIKNSLLHSIIDKCYAEGKIQLALSFKKLKNNKNS